MLDQFNRQKWLKKFKLKEFPQSDYIKLNYPVLLCHGYGSIASMIKPSPLHDVCMLMREHCIPSFAPNIVPYAKIETRAEAWVDMIEQVIETTGASKLNVVAHSMGGLDIRYALSNLDMAANVESLTTVATPHHGTSLAEFALNAPKTIREKLGTFFDWIGDNLYPQIKSDSIGSAEQLTRDYIEQTFNPSTPNVPTVSYYSYSATVGEQTSTPIAMITRFQNKLIYDREGLNDGFVSKKSAIWGKHVKSIHLSHLEQMKLNLDKKRIPVWQKFWTELLLHLSKQGH